MFLSDLLVENVNLSSERIVDLRGDKPVAHGTLIVLTATGAILYYWGENWKEVYPIIKSQIDKSVQNDINDILVLDRNFKGILIDINRGGGWSGERNRYSKDVKHILSRLSELGIIAPSTQVYLGNWAGERVDQKLGSASRILKSPDTPNVLTLYHGTSNARYSQILQNGLAPLDVDQRVWSRDKKTTIPHHREGSVYLAATTSLAEYYARKAVKVDRQRLTTRYFSSLAGKLITLHNTLATQNLYHNEKGALETKQKIDKLKQAQELLKKMAANTDKLAPVIFSVDIPKSEWRMMMADDDFILKMKRRGVEVDPTNWRESLSDFGQIAYLGRIEPSRIKLVKSSNEST